MSLWKTLHCLKCPSGGRYLCAFGFLPANDLRCCRNLFPGADPAAHFLTFRNGVDTPVPFEIHPS
jgi:hypothetical protein